VSIEDQATCDGSTMIIETITITVDADVSTENLKGKKNMIKSKKNNKPQPKIDVCVSTKLPWNFDAIKTMDSTVICVQYMQTDWDGWCF